MENYNRGVKISMNGQQLRKHSCGNSRKIKTGKGIWWAGTDAH